MNRYVAGARRAVRPAVATTLRFARRRGLAWRSRLTTRAAPSGLAVRVVDGRRLWARPADHLQRDAHQRALCLRLMQALDRAGVDFFAIPQTPRFPASLAIPDSARGAALAALAALPEPRSTVVAPVRIDRVGASYVAHTMPLTEAARLDDGVLRVVDVAYDVASPATHDLSTGIDLEFWATADPAGWRAPRANCYLAALPPDATPRVEVGWRDLAYRTVEPMAHPLVDDVTFPVDVVYTWVDGSDQAWQRRRAEALGVADIAAFTEEAASEARFADHDELRHSLRSLDQFADWVNHVWIVTDQQVPDWLDTGHPKITVVDHRDIWNAGGILPTFNSHAIEANLHHIDGLSEHFLYLNDDVLFGRPVTPATFFFGNGQAKLFYSRAQLAGGAPAAGEPAPDSAGKNARRLLQQRFGVTTAQKFFHTPIPLQRSVSYEIEHEFPDEWRETTRSRFRRMTDITVSGSFHLYYAYATRRAVPGLIDYRYVDVSTAPERLATLRTGVHDAICINETAGASTGRGLDRQVRATLDRLYPSASSFERQKRPAAASLTTDAGDASSS